MITVVDAPCGAGKTTWAIQYMNSHPDEPFIFVTPFLTEIQRIIDATGSDSDHRFYDPQFINRPQLLGGETFSKTKGDDFYDLLDRGYNIATTHTTFQHMSKETVTAIMQGEYHLILDEAVDVLSPYNDVVRDPMDKVNAGDAGWLLANNIIAVADDCRVKWLGKDIENMQEFMPKYYTIQKYAEAGSLILVDNTFFAWEFPPDVFQMAKDVTILTYLFDSSFVAPYFKIHGIPYEKVGVRKVPEKDEYELCEYHEDLELRKKWLELIDLFDDGTVYKGKALSATWYKRNITLDVHLANDATKELSKDLESFLKKVKAKPSDTMWTCPKGNRHNMAPKGFFQTRTLSDEEKTGKDTAAVDAYLEESNLMCWAPSVMKATNKYANRHVLAYMLNFYANPEIVKYFKSMQADFDIGAYSLSCLIQWIWRSAIRNGEKISLYLPSKRMRSLLVDFLNGKI